MKYIAILFLFIVIIRGAAQNFRKIYLSRLNDVRYQCLDPSCPPSTNMSIGNIRNCEVACLSDDNCRTLTYDQSRNRCELFVDIPTQYGSLVAQAGIVTMTAIDDRRLSARMTTSTTTTTTTTSTTTTTTTTTPLPFPLVGVTVAGYGNGTAGSANNAATYPWGLAIGPNDSFYISHYGGFRVMKMKIGNLTGSIVAGTGVQGSDATKLYHPAEIAVDAAANIYIADTTGCRVMLWRNNSMFGVPVVGNGTCGNSAGLIGESIGLALDSQGNIYVADSGYHRVMKWAPNATSGVVIAGTTGVPGNTNQLLNRPYGLYLDENNSYIYIADLNNNRIQRYRLGDASNGTTVAGGYGAGNGSHQLSGPYDVCVSKKTGAIYVADIMNNRVQRFSPGAINGTTIAGMTGMTGINARLLKTPSNVALDMDETYLYVSDMDNHRVQRYRLF